MVSQAPDTILMVRPANFGYNPLTAGSNVFQKTDAEISSGVVKSQGRLEFDLFAERIRASDIDVITVEDSPEPITPDAVFPNNWISFHHDGTVVLYPMMAENRRLERRKDIILTLQNRYHFRVERIIDLSIYEQSGHFLEGTGSMVMDYVNRKVYANPSPRTDEFVIDRFCREMNFRKVMFTSVDEEGQDIYHTNVVMCIGTGYVVICLESIVDEAERINVMRSFEETGHEIIDISYLQMTSFAGNLLEVNNKKGEPVLIMSETAFRVLGKDQLKTLEKYTDILYASLDTMEKYGGGSARCMISGVFLPRI